MINKVLKLSDDAQSFKKPKQELKTLKFLILCKYSELFVTPQTQSPASCFFFFLKTKKHSSVVKRLLSNWTAPSDHLFTFAVFVSAFLFLFKYTASSHVEKPLQRLSHYWVLAISDCSRNYCWSLCLSNKQTCFFFDHQYISTVQRIFSQTGTTTGQSFWSFTLSWQEITITIFSNFSKECCKCLYIRLIMK